VISSSWLTKNPMGPWAVLEALALGAKNMVLTAVLLVAIGVVIAAVTISGVGNTFSLMIGTWAGGSVLIAIVLIALASLVLGMGLPVTAAYIVIATLSAPALADLIMRVEIDQRHRRRQHPAIDGRDPDAGLARDGRRDRPADVRTTRPPRCSPPRPLEMYRRSSTTRSAAT
jgi:hypothetical protein